MGALRMILAGILTIAAFCALAGGARAANTCPAGQVMTGWNYASGANCAAAGAGNFSISIGWIAGIDPNGATLAVINQNSTISSIRGAVEIATGTAATVSVYKAPSGTACSGGTILHSGSLDANGTAGTNQTLTLAITSLAAGDRLCLQTTGTTAWTTGTGVGGITVFLTPT